MTLLDELRLERDYWLVPVYSGDRFDATWPATGKIDKIVMVKKGANDPDIELCLQLNEAMMAAALGDQALADRISCR